MGRRPSSETMRQSALRLPNDLHEKLVAAGGSRGMGEEIRRRLEASFDAEPKLKTTDRRTGELLEAIAHLADTIALDAEWHADRFAFEVFRTAVDTILAHYQPEGEPEVNAAQVHVFFGIGDKPETVGRTLAATVIRDMPKFKAKR